MFGGYQKGEPVEVRVHAGRLDRDAVFPPLTNKPDRIGAFVKVDVAGEASIDSQP
ncbi:MAG: hypothetical protein AAF483_14710 [Planctomycetota bacterium]